MRTIPASAERLAVKRERAVHVRVTLSSDRVVSWSVTLTALEGRNWVKSITTRRSHDARVATANVVLWREEFELSLAPYVESKLNRVDGTAVQLLEGARKIHIEVQLQPYGEPAYDSGEWTSIFHGYVDEIDFGGEEPEITLSCRDDYAVLVDEFVYQDQPRKDANWWNDIPWDVSLETLVQTLIDGCILDGSSAARQAWDNGIVYAVGDHVRPTTRNGYYYRCTTAGTTGAGEPTWPTTIGETVDDNGLVWTCMGELPELYTPVATGVNIQEPQAGTSYVTPGSLDSILDRLVSQIGFDLRYRYHEGTSAWRLTLRSPEGSSTGVIFENTLTNIPKWQRTRADVRNIVRVPWVDGDGKWTVETYPDPTTWPTPSMQAFGRRPYQLSQEECLALHSEADAAAVAATILRDLESPHAAVELEMPLYPYPEPGDTFFLRGESRYTTDSREVSVIGVEERIEGGSATSTTTLACFETGETPRYFNRRHFRNDIRSAFNQGLGKQTTLPGLATGPTLTGALGACGVLVTPSAGQVLGSPAEQVEFDIITYDYGGNYDAGAFRFTAPRTGIYISIVSLVGDMSDGGDEVVHLFLYKNGSSIQESTWKITGLTTGGVGQTAFTFLTAGDYLEIFVLTSAFDSYTLDETQCSWIIKPFAIGG